ncbi:pyridoxamine 5'-phosphate oxidase-domain-containing protein [Umbelopsis sp. PMI_123]|nr:pyridoxamine 5'-phosphate oxidase-domain-containing protein [Umbelopsis sp. PMI_123]
MNPRNPAWKVLLLSQLSKNIKEARDAAYVSLATIRPDGSPANRTVAFRGFVAQDHEDETGWGSDLLLFTCDKRTEKMKEIRHDPRVEVSWWMSTTGEQFRIRGRMHLIENGTEDLLKDHIYRKENIITSSNYSAATTSFLARLNHLSHAFGKDQFSWEAERLRHWYKISDDLRATFTWPHPGLPYEEDGKFVKSLSIEHTENNGWFKHGDKQKQALLEEGYSNFVLLALEVDSIDYVELYSMPCRRRTYNKHNDEWIEQPLNP